MLAAECSLEDRLAALILVFEDRCHVLAARARAGQLCLLDAVDMAQSAAEWSGVAEVIGDDQVQTVLRAAFMNVPRAACSTSVRKGLE